MRQTVNVEQSSTQQLHSQKTVERGIPHRLFYFNLRIRCNMGICGNRNRSVRRRKRNSFAGFRLLKG